MNSCKTFAITSIPLILGVDFLDSRVGKLWLESCKLIADNHGRKRLAIVIFGWFNYNFQEKGLRSVMELSLSP